MRSIAGSRSCRVAESTHALVTAGGDSRIIGDRFGKPWVVGIRHPDRKDEVIARIPLVDTAISTSGDYERYFDENGVRYHHIIDPQTGHSASKVRSATISVRPRRARTACRKPRSCWARAGARDLQPARRHRCDLRDADGGVLYTKGLEAPEATARPRRVVGVNAYRRDRRMRRSAYARHAHRTIDIAHAPHGLTPSARKQKGRINPAFFVSKRYFEDFFFAAAFFFGAAAFFCVLSGTWLRPSWPSPRPSSRPWPSSLPSLRPSSRFSSSASFLAAAFSSAQPSSLGLRPHPLRRRFVGAASG